jgi:hypothetical protein
MFEPSQRTPPMRLSDMVADVDQIMTVNIGFNEPSIVDIVLRELHKTTGKHLDDFATEWNTVKEKYNTSLGHLFRSNDSLFAMVNFWGRNVPYEITLVPVATVPPDFRFRTWYVSMDVEDFPAEGMVFHLQILPEYKFCRSIEKGNARSTLKDRIFVPNFDNYLVLDNSFQTTRNQHAYGAAYQLIIFIVGEAGNRFDSGYND